MKLKLYWRTDFAMDQEINVFGRNDYPAGSKHVGLTHKDCKCCNVQMSNFVNWVDKYCI